MVNTELLQKQCQQYKMSKDSLGEYHKQLFTLYPELANYYDAEDIDPDSIPKSQKFMMLGQQELQSFFKLPSAMADERKWRCALADFKEIYADIHFPIDNFNKAGEALVAALEKHAGGVSAEQKKEWEALFAKACADMKEWGWQ